MCTSLIFTISSNLAEPTKRAVLVGASCVTPTDRLWALDNYTTYSTNSKHAAIDHIIVCVYLVVSARVTLYG